MTESVRFLAFTADQLTHEVGTSHPALYLQDYLVELEVSSMVVEPHYVDRHYLDDFANYYARSFRPPAAHCRRLHFFSGMDAGAVEAAFDAAIDDAGDGAARKRLNDSYLGFVVRRPLDAAPLGRTVLRTYPLDGRRYYATVRPYSVHVLGVALSVEGLAYQQQDGGAAVCASTALWVALQRVAHVAGHRTPTPHAITQAARSPFPASHGLLENQMAQAISAFGYSADRFVPGVDRALFRARLAACLDSKLPVVLGLIQKVATPGGETVFGHAVTVTGYARSARVGEIPSHETEAPLRMCSASINTLYVHDDNLGFHAHYELSDSPEIDSNGQPVLKLQRGRTSNNPCWWKPDFWDVESALVPKPDKMRLPVESLISNAAEAGSLVQAMFPTGTFRHEVRFLSGVEYVTHLLGLRLDRSDLRTFLRTVSLPRHLALLAAYDGADRPIVEVAMDATTIAQDPQSLPLLAIVGPGIEKDSLYAVRAVEYARALRVPFVPAPRTDPST